MSSPAASALGAMAIPMVLLKNAKLSELAEIVVYEVAFREALLAVHRAVASEAIANATDVLERRRDRPVDEALFDEALGALDATFARLTEDKIRPVVRRLVRRIYEASKKVTWRRGIGLIKEPLVYEFHDVQKNEDPPWASIEAVFSLVDEDAIAALERFNVLWAGRYYDRTVSEAIRRVVREEVFKQGLSGREAGRALRDVLRRELGLTDVVPTTWKGGSPDNYFKMVAASTATTARAFGAIQALSDLGVRYAVWHTALDERVCLRCGAMEGRRIPIDRAFDQMERHLAATTPESLKAAHPWYSEKDFLEIVEGADGSGDPENHLADHDVMSPPAHGSCRCTLDYDSDIDPTFGPDADAVHAALRETIAENVIGQLSNLTSTQRSVVYETIGVLAPWLNLVSVALVAGAVVESSDVSEPISDLLDVLTDGQSIHVTEDGLDTASVGEYNALAFGLAHIALKQLPIDPLALRSLYENAKSKGLTLHPSAVDPEIYFAQGFEAYTEVAPSDVRPDRRALQKIDPALFSLLDKIVQDRMILGLGEILSEASASPARMPRELDRSEARAVEILNNAANVSSRDDFLSFQAELVAVLLTLPEEERRHHANAYGSLGVRRGWISL